MKKILILVALALIALVALPPVAGRVAEDQITSSLEKASDNGLISYDIRDYKRGWLRSSGLIEIRLSEQYARLLADMAAEEAGNAPENPDESLGGLLGKTMLLDLDLTHGPVVLDKATFVGWSAAVITLESEDAELSELAAQLELPYLMQLRSRIGFDGMTAFEAEIPPCTYLDELSEMTFSGFSLAGTFDGARLEASGGTERFALDSLTADIEMTDFRIVGNQDNFAPYLWLGTTEISVGRFATSSELEPELGQFEMIDLGIYGDVTLSQKPGHVDMEMRYSLDSMTGPDVDLQTLDVRLLLQQIDIASLEMYYKLSSELGVSDAATLQEESSGMQAALHKALAGSPSLALEPLSFRLNKEPFDATIELKVAGDKLPPAESWDIDDTQTWSTIASFDAETRIARGLALQIATQTLEQQLLASSTPDNPIDPAEAERMAEQQAPALLDVLVLQGLLTKTDDGFAGTASYNNNTLTVNGTPVPLGP